MCRFLLWSVLAAAVVGCASSEPTEEPASARDRDGFAGQMGVMAGDPNDYGD
ncbi:MAG: hypothetical protein WD716_02260 [Fimbriimonadaceae bacterium]